jgi:broad-like protein
MGSEKFCLRWNDFESNISSAFRELRDDKDFFDVTLACDDEQIQAHKVILSACSQFFRNVLRRNPHQHPLLYLKGVKFTDLQSVLNFMYHGEVNVAQEELNSFLAVAEDLRVKGLTQNQSGPSKRETCSLPKSPPIIKPTPKATERDPIQPLKRPRPTPVISSIPQTSIDDDDIQELVPVKTEPREAAAPPPPQPQPIAPPQEQFYSPATGTQALAPADDQMVEYQDESYEDYGDYSAEHPGYEGAMGEGQGGDGTKGKNIFALQPKG